MLKRFFLLVFVLASATAAIAQDAPTVPKVINGGVVNGKAVSLVKPIYPPAAQAVNASGAVNVQVTIDENGDVIIANAVSGHPLLRAAAVEAARASKFSPTKLSGVFVKVNGVIVYNFAGGPAPVKKHTWYGLGASLAVISSPNGRTSVGQNEMLTIIPEDWNEIRSMVGELEKLRGARGENRIYERSNPEAIALAKDVFRVIELKLEDSVADVWRFRLGRALMNGGAARFSGDAEVRRQAAFAIRELAFVTPPGIDVKTVDELTEMSDVIEKGSKSGESPDRYSELFLKMQELFN